MLLQELPPEILENILSYLNSADILKVTWCSQKLRKISTNEQVWIKCALREYSIDLHEDNYSDGNGNLHNGNICTSARLFTIKVLMPIGPHFQNIWQLTNFKYYGGFAKLLYHNWCIYLVLLDPPPFPNTHKAMQSEILCRLYLNQQTNKVSEIYIANQKHLMGHEPPFEISKSKSDQPTLKSFCGPLTPLTYDNDSFLKLFQERFGMRFLDLAAERMHRRIDFINSKLQIFQPLKTNTLNPPFCPILPGIFKGTYSAHGIEIISVTYEEDLKTLTGRKVVGDPNVPFDQISFQANLDKPMFLRKEEQASFDLIKEYMIENDVLIDTTTKKDPSPRRFNTPFNCRIDASIEREVFQNELWRFQGRCQVAFDGYVEPRFIDGNVVIFSEDIFGVIFIDLQSLGIFERVQEPLYKAHFIDVLQKTPSDVLGKY